MKRIKLIILVLVASSCIQQKELEHEQAEKLREGKIADFIARYSADSIWNEKFDFYSSFSFQLEEYFQISERPVYIKGLILDIQKDSSLYAIHFFDFINYYYLVIDKSLVDKVIELGDSEKYSEYHIIAKIQEVSKIGFSLTPSYMDEYDFELDLGFNNTYRMYGECLDIEKH